MKKTNNNLIKIIDGGSLVKRLRLLADQLAYKFWEEAEILTRTEEDKLVKSITSTDRGINKYNELIRFLKNLHTALVLLETYEQSYLRWIDRLSGYVYLWQSYLQTGHLLNTIYYKFEGEPEVQKKISEAVDNPSSFTFSKFNKTKKYGFELDIGEPVKDPTKSPKPEGERLRWLLDISKYKVGVELSNAKGVIASILDYSHFIGYHPTAYREKLKAIEERLKEDRTILSVHSKKKTIDRLKKAPEGADFFYYPEYGETAKNEEVYNRILTNIFDADIEEVKEATNEEG